MPNIRVRTALEKISRDLSRLIDHVSEHSGIAEKNVAVVNNEASRTACCCAHAPRRSFG